MLADELIDHLSKNNANLVTRDLSKGVSLIDESWIQANFTPEEERTKEQRGVLQESDDLIAELEKTDVIVVALPIYNFGVPAAFKAWIDLVTRAKKTFRYGANGPKGLLAKKRAFVVVTSGGTLLGSVIDFVSDWLKHALNFIGISDLTIIDASGLMKDEEEILASAQEKISSINLEEETQSA
jgi:FMN-dependent NADH-azoreductase